jgi:D-alanyl-lipoteichoic acid acyltransferase DltB (MBOAT superfamily)
MTLTHILVFCIITVLLIWIGRGRWRGWLLLVASVLAIYWLQPSTPIRNLDFWLPTASVGLVVLVWAATRPGETIVQRQDLITSGVMAGLILVIALTRYFDPLCCLTPTRPPALPLVIAALGGVTLVAIVTIRLSPKNLRLDALYIMMILAIFLVLKTPALAQATSGGLRTISGQVAGLATPLDLRWLGFSYLAFRLIHTLRDRVSGKLPGLSLMDFTTYAIFFPAVTAGPIDRVQRFSGDLQKMQAAIIPNNPSEKSTKNYQAILSPISLSWQDAYEGGQRILLGVFKKFVVADSLAIIALNGTNAPQTTSTGWMWVLVYAYSLRLYLDFSGYTDIAIGLGRLVGIRLPENFDNPYLKPNLTAFWNSWHITLAQWFRSYFFNPVTRSLRMNPRNFPLPSIIFVGQLSTMVLIGLWHGVTWNFAAWGLWQGIGLFIHNRWSEATRTRFSELDIHPGFKSAMTISGILLTFNYVTIGWVWFALPTLSSSWHVLLMLFGIR